ncbi:AAA family ATPase [Glutamicibacter sp. NPDC087344]|uniref:AAA family ATPase n=1 Tax=Glutamicibacter sp. NPDC087344 TaxID=3363994 RepID=UPI003825606B
MSALPGGAADKLGNQFETWWTINRISSLLRGEASSMRLEPPGDEGEGIEFWIDEGGVRWCEQVKHVPSTRNWTIGVLKERKVLSRIQNHLANGHKVRLVLSTPGADIEDLTSRARDSEDLEEFHKIATGPSQEHFQALAAHWEVSPGTAWTYLRNLHIEHHTEHTLEPLVRSRIEQLLSGNPAVAMNELAGWLTSQLHQTITGPSVWDQLKAQGFERRLLVDDPNALKSLLSTVERHRRKVSQLKPSSILTDQNRIDSVIDWLMSAESEGQQILLLHGTAGSGKSTLVDAVLRNLNTMGWYSAVLSMDKTLPDVHTSNALGRSAELVASPAVLLAGVSNGTPAVLFIDQLDAVATYSGRMQDNYDSIDEVLSEATANPNLRIVLVIRTVDLLKDPRLGRLRSDKHRVAELKIGPFTPAQVADALGRSGVAPNTVDADTMKLLEVPLHYAVFSQLDMVNKSTSFSTLPDLYERFTEQFLRDTRARVGSMNWHSISGPLVSYMSENEALRAPASVLHSADPFEVDGLISYGILFKERSSISFFHETYFDYLFAEGFIASSGNLEAFLLESGQALFRRGQTRQVLEYLAKTDRPKFLHTVIRLLTNNSIRSHLLDIPLVLLRQFDARADDWRALRSLAFGTTRRSHQLLALLSEPAWFDAADAVGDWEIMLADQDKLALVADHLSCAARVRPKRVADLVRPYLGIKGHWKSIFSALLSRSLSPALVPLAVELLEGGHVDGVRGSMSVNSDFLTILYTLSEDAPSEAARVMGAYLRRATYMSALEGVADPFDADHLPNTLSSGGEEVISRIASGSPEQYLHEVLPFVTNILQKTAKSGVEFDLRRGTRWNYRYPGRPLGIDKALFSGLDTALHSLQEGRLPELLDYIRPLMESDIEELRFLSCRALNTSNLADIAAQWLISDPRNLELGYASSSRWSSRELVETATKNCTPKLLEQLTEILINYYPWYERSAHERSYFGRAQFELLTAIDPAKRNRDAIRRIQELERKFKHLPSPPQPIIANFAGAPIPQAAAEFLTDPQWIGAISTHESDSVQWSHSDGPRGGIRQLSSLLGERAVKEPERFARLAMELDNPIHAGHIGAILRSVAGKIPIDLLIQLCEHGRQVAGEKIGRDICWAVETVASEAPGALVELVINCCSDEDPECDSARTKNATGDYLYGGDLSSAGLNSTRGAAAVCLARILFAQPHLCEQLLSPVRELASDPIMAVRVRSAEAILALLNTLPDQALEIAQDMFTMSPTDIFSTYECAELLKHAVLRRSCDFAPHLLRALTADDATAKRAAYPWIVAYINGSIEDPAPHELNNLSAPARYGVAEALIGSLEAAPEIVAQLMHDSDADVREAAARALWRIHEIDQQTAEMLVKEFMESLAFSQHGGNLFASLEESTTVLPPSTIDACERFVKSEVPEPGGTRVRPAMGGSHLVAVVLRLYKQGSEDIRRRCLNVIDRLSDMDAFGLEGALDQERL